MPISLDARGSSSFAAVLELVGRADLVASERFEVGQIVLVDRLRILLCDLPEHLRGAAVIAAAEDIVREPVERIRRIALHEPWSRATANPSRVATAKRHRRDRWRLEGLGIGGMSGIAGMWRHRC